MYIFFKEDLVVKPQLYLICLSNNLQPHTKLYYTVMILFSSYSPKTWIKMKKQERGFIIFDCFSIISFTSKFFFFFNNKFILNISELKLSDLRLWNWLVQILNDNVFCFFVKVDFVHFELFCHLLLLLLQLVDGMLLLKHQFFLWSISQPIRIRFCVIFEISRLFDY